MRKILKLSYLLALFLKPKIRAALSAAEVVSIREYFIIRLMITVLPASPDAYQYALFQAIIDNELEDTEDAISLTVVILTTDSLRKQLKINYLLKILADARVQKGLAKKVVSIGQFVDSCLVGIPYTADDLKGIVSAEEKTLKTYTVAAKILVNPMLRDCLDIEYLLQLANNIEVRKILPNTTEYLHYCLRRYDTVRSKTKSEEKGMSGLINAVTQPCLGLLSHVPYLDSYFVTLRNSLRDFSWSYSDFRDLLLRLLTERRVQQFFTDEILPRHLSTYLILNLLEQTTGLHVLAPFFEKVNIRGMRVELAFMGKTFPLNTIKRVAAILTLFEKLQKCEAPAADAAELIKSILMGSIPVAEEINGEFDSRLHKRWVDSEYFSLIEFVKEIWLSSPEPPKRMTVSPKDQWVTVIRRQFVVVLDQTFKNGRFSDPSYVKGMQIVSDTALGQRRSGRAGRPKTEEFADGIVLQHLSARRIAIRESNKSVSEKVMVLIINSIVKLQKEITIGKKTKLRFLEEVDSQKIRTEIAALEQLKTACNATRGETEEETCKNWSAPLFAAVENLPDLLGRDETRRDLKECVELMSTVEMVDKKRFLVLIAEDLSNEDFWLQASVVSPVSSSKSTPLQEYGQQLKGIMQRYDSQISMVSGADTEFRSLSRESKAHAGSKSRATKDEITHVAYCTVIGTLKSALLASKRKTSAELQTRIAVQAAYEQLRQIDLNARNKIVHVSRSFP